MLYVPNEEGQGLLGCALFLGVFAVIIIVILALLAPAIGNVYSNIIRSL